MAAMTVIIFYGILPLKLYNARYQCPTQSIILQPSEEHWNI